MLIIFIRNTIAKPFSESNMNSLKSFLNLWKSLSFQERSNLHQNINYTGTRKYTKDCLSCYSEGNEEINYRFPKQISQYLHFLPHNHAFIIIKAFSLVMQNSKMIYNFLIFPRILTIKAYKLLQLQLYWQKHSRGSRGSSITVTIHHKNNPPRTYRPKNLKWSPKPGQIVAAWNGQVLQK